MFPGSSLPPRSAVVRCDETIRDKLKVGLTARGDLVRPGRELGHRYQSVKHYVRRLEPESGR